MAYYANADSPVKTVLKGYRMNRKLTLVALVTLLSASSCAKKSQDELIADFKKTETESCINSWKASNSNGAPESMIVSVCGCSIEKLVNAHPLEKLKEMAATNDPALQSTMMPMVMECAEQENRKTKAS